MEITAQIITQEQEPKKCSYCQGDLVMGHNETGQLIRIGNCNVCKALHHETCWSENGLSCAVHLCQGNTLVNLRIPITREQRIEQARQELETAMASDNPGEIRRVWARHQQLLGHDASLQQRIDRVIRRATELAKLQSAISKNDDVQIVTIWKNVAELLADYSPAQAHRPRVELAEARLAALEALQGCKTDPQRVDVWQRHEQLLRDYSPADLFRQQAQQAQQRLQAIAQLRQAIADRDDERIVACWQRHEKSLRGYWYPEVAQAKQASQRLQARYQALERLQEAINSNKDSKIVATWRQTKSVLDGYPPAEVYRQRIELAERRVTALEQFRIALDRSDEQLVDIYLNNYDLLEEWAGFSESQRGDAKEALQRVATQQATLVRRAILEANDEKIANAYQKNESLFKVTNVFSADEQARITLALRRIQALNQLREELATQDAEKILALYNRHKSLLRPCRNFSSDERRQVRESTLRYWSQRLRDAIQAGDEKTIASVGQQAIDAGCVLEEEQYDAIYQAQHTLHVLDRLTEAIDSGDDQAIVLRYMPHVFDRAKSASPTPEQLERIQLAQKRLDCWFLLQEALKREDDFKIAQLYDQALFANSPLLDSKDHVRCELAVRRQVAFDKLQAAFQSNNDQRIVEAYDESLLARSSLLSQSQKQRLEQAKKQVSGVEAFTKALKNEEVLEIGRAYQTSLKAGIKLPDEINWKVVVDAWRQVEALDKLRQVLHSDSSDDESIAKLGKPILDSTSEMLGPNERRRITLAVQRVGALQRLRQALAANDRQKVAHVYQPKLLEPCSAFTAEERQEVKRILSHL